MRIENNLLWSAQSLNTSTNSNPIWLGHAFGYAVQVTVTGTVTGTLKLQSSCDAGGEFDTTSPPTVTNWTDVPSATSAVAGAGTYSFNIADANYPWARIVWTQSTNTGTANARVNTKGF